jgi:hypothetical protein
LERRIQGPRVTQQVQVFPTLFLGRAGDKAGWAETPYPRTRTQERFHTTTLVLCKTGVGVFESSRVAARSQLSHFRSEQVGDTGPAE